MENLHIFFVIFKALNLHYSTLCRNSGGKKPQMQHMNEYFTRTHWIKL